MMESIWFIIFGFPVWAWSHMTPDARHEMRRWFWLMLVVGGIAGTAWTYVRDRLV
jgi:hypothetical protein